MELELERSKTDSGSWRRGGEIAPAEETDTGGSDAEAVTSRPLRAATRAVPDAVIVIRRHLILVQAVRQSSCYILPNCK